MDMGERMEQGLSNGSSQPTAQLQNDPIEYSEFELCPRRGDNRDSNPIAIHCQLKEGAYSLRPGQACLLLLYLLHVLGTLWNLNNY